MKQDHKKMAVMVLHRAFGGSVPGQGSNFPGVKKRLQESQDYLGYPKERSNFKAPKEEFQSSPGFFDEKDEEGFSRGGEVDEGKMMAAEEILAAFKQNDPKALIESLEAFVSQCHMNDAEELE